MCWGRTTGREREGGDVASRSNVNDERGRVLCTGLTNFALNTRKIQPA